MNFLKKTKSVIIGPMQYASGRSIRAFFTEELTKMNITVLDHYNKPFLSNSIKESEGEELHRQFRQWMDVGEYDKLAAYKDIRRNDLAIVEKSDFIIFHFIPGVVTVGSWEEFFLANSIKRPIFFITDGGKHLTPFWVMWTIPHNYIYNSKEEVLDVIQKINSGEKEIDSARWRLLREDLR